MLTNNKADIIRLQKYMKPSGCCQACLSQNQLPKDCIITCEICRSCIHQTHYGSELLQPLQVWQCERCRHFLEHGPEDIHCEFCPNLRGIMKKYLFGDRKIWLHPECAVWGYPIIFFSSLKREGIRKQKPKSESTYFWVRDYDDNPNPCQVCSQLSGYRIKCKYYSCNKSYHVTCARPEGIIRDLESMKIENGAGYLPVYCKEHILLKIDDAKKRTKLLKDKGDIEKAAHFQKLSGIYAAQLKNLEDAVKKWSRQQQMIQKMSMETRRHIEGTNNLDFNELEQSFTSQKSNEFLELLQSEMVDEQLPLLPLQKLRSLQYAPLPHACTSLPRKSSTSPPVQREALVEHSQILNRSSIEVEPALSLPNQTYVSQEDEVMEEEGPANKYDELFEQF